MTTTPAPGAPSTSDPDDLTTVHVDGAPGYDVTIGHGAALGLASAIPAGARQALFIHAPALATVAEELKRQVEAARPELRVLIAEVPDAEDAKRVEVAAFCWGIMGQSDFNRSDAVVGLGGGATTDLAGFVAATWLRGVAVVQVPSTVLGMVDAAIGGKTGINTNEGKNLVGTFTEPRAVLCDLDLLASLSENEVRAGFAEVVKCGFIRDERIIELIEADPERAVDPGTPEFRECLERAIRVKADVVGGDFTEQGEREILNYGHTLGHAIEHTERYQWRHGAAIAIGMNFAAELARLSGRLSDADADRHRRVLAALKLPLTYPANRWPTLLATMQRDKKVRQGMLRFIVLDAIGRPTVLQAPAQETLFAAYQDIAS